MFILPQEYKEQYIKGMETYIHDLLYTFQIEGKPIDFVRLIEVVGYNGENLIREVIFNYLDLLDRNFKDSAARKERYYVKDYRKRTIVTMYGEISYYRTVYVDKDSGKRFIYVDRKLGIRSRIRYTDDVRAYVYEAYADENSMIKVGKEVGNLIHCKFSLKRNDEYALSRQTIYSFLKKIKPVHYIPEEKIKAQSLFILLDEKFIGCQDLDKKIMSKACMVYSDMEHSKRNRLLNRTFYSSYDPDFRYDLLTFIDEVYDLSKVKQMYLMGDGGNWIKETFKEMSLPEVKQTICLDAFHSHRALYELCRDYTPYSIALYYVSRRDQDSFTKAIKHFVRTNKDEENYRYLINNFEETVNMYYAPGPCAMEQCISHHLMSQFTSVPKAYSSKNIERYLSMRDNYRNRRNMRKIYLTALEKQSAERQITPINRYQLDFSIFDRGQDIPYYDTGNIKGRSLFLPH